MLRKNGDRLARRREEVRVTDRVNLRKTLLVVQLLTTERTDGDEDRGPGNLLHPLAKKRKNPVETLLNGAQFINRATAAHEMAAIWLRVERAVREVVVLVLFDKERLTRSAVKPLSVTSLGPLGAGLHVHLVNDVLLTARNDAIVQLPLVLSNDRTHRRVWVCPAVARTPLLVLEQLVNLDVVIRLDLCLRKNT